jgi:hypothetical protein
LKGPDGKELVGTPAVTVRANQYLRFIPSFMSTHFKLHFMLHFMCLAGHDDGRPVAALMHVAECL